MQQLPASPCYLNGAYTPLNEAKISVLDRGFIFGDGVYEVIPIYNGRPFRMAQHMARLDRSLAELRIANPLSHHEWQAVATNLVANYRLSTWTFGINDAQNPVLATGAGDFLIYIQVTRGVAMRDHVMTQGISPTVFVMCNPMKPLPPEQRAAGVACVSADDFRWQKAHIKTTSLLGAVFARQISYDAGALETVMFRGDFLSEAAASNVWVVKDGAVFGPPNDNLVLEGIRYGLFAEVCQAAGIPFTLRPITRAEVLAADELLLSSATKEVLAITTLDGKAVGHGAAQGKAGPVCERLHTAYQNAKLA
jgi:D-alanine transaminase